MSDPVDDFLMGMHKSPSVTVGGGVPRMDVLMADGSAKDLIGDLESPAEAPTEFTDKRGNVFKLDALGQKQWSGKATFENQRSKPGLWKQDAPIAAVFNLSVPEQLTAYNKLLEGIVPFSDPSIDIVEVDRKFFEGSFIIFVSYSKIWYLLPIKK